jgi:hypothetical protein
MPGFFVRVVREFFFIFFILYVFPFSGFYFVLISRRRLLKRGEVPLPPPRYIDLAFFQMMWFSARENINVDMVSSTLCSGSTFKKYSELFQAIDGSHVGNTKFFEIQRTLMQQTEEVFIERTKEAVKRIINLLTERAC